MKSDKKGSASVLIAMVFTVMMAGILSAVSISKALVTKSECKCFGAVWAMAVLSEYDVHLLRDYGIMAYQGNEDEITDRLNFYMSYSAKNRPNTSIKGAAVDLSGYEVRNTDNFRNSLKKNTVFAAADSILTADKRIRRTGKADSSRIIRNRVVLDTLPSCGMRNTFDLGSIKTGLESGEIMKRIGEKSSNAAVETAFIRKYLNNHMTLASEKKTFFSNEWEYIVRGSPSDGENFQSCRRRIFLIRNAFNLAYLYKDPEKVRTVTAIAEIITPGPAGAATQVLIMETWAAAEADEDVDVLLSGGRVPLMKTAATWKTDIESVLGKKEVVESLDEESRKRLREKNVEIKKHCAKTGYEGSPAEGHTYDDYVIFLILATNENVRLLRIMDIIQINMKYRYYEDFNLEEYYCGVRFDLKANGRRYGIEKEYK